MTLCIQVLDSSNSVRFERKLEISEELFHSPETPSETVDGLIGVKTALDYAIQCGDR